MGMGMAKASQCLISWTTKVPCLQLNTQDTCLGATSVSFTAWRPTRSTRGCHIGGAISRLRLNPWTGNIPPWKSWRPQKNGCACMMSCTKRRSDVSHYVIIIRLICVENTEKLKNTASAPFMDFIWFLLLFLALAPNVRAGGQRTDDHIDKQEQKHRRWRKNDQKLFISLHTHSICFKRNYGETMIKN